MARYFVRGGRPLSGTITPSGNKNAALPILAAALLTEKEVTLENVPDIVDVGVMIEILRALGAAAERKKNGDVVIEAKSIKTTEVPAKLSTRVRASILFAGPLVARCGSVDIPPPGGDVIGRRRLDTHFFALEQLGAVVAANGTYKVEATRGLKGTEMFLDEASVTGTENAIMAAVLAKGTTVIEHAAYEPHVQDLCNFLNLLGAKIEGVGSGTLTIKGVEKLGGGKFRIGPDHIEAGSWMSVAAVTGGEMVIKDLRPKDMRMTLAAYAKLGLKTLWRGNDLFVPGGQTLEVQSDMHGAVPKLDDGPWPAFPSDLLPITLVVATQSKGTVLIHEKMFESRLYFTDRLQGMGAQIILCDPHRAVIVGPSKLYGQRVESPDVRAGMAMVVAGLCAKGETRIGNIYQIERGYERLVEKVTSLGGSMERVED